MNRKNSLPQKKKTHLSKPEVRGKYLYCGEEKLFIKGVTYGAFRPGSDGSLFPEPNITYKDIKKISETGINCIRTYTVPSQWLLDLALEHGIYVMVDLPWISNTAFLENRKQIRETIQQVSQAVKKLNQHPAILCYSIGNEIPSTLVRYYGKKKIESFLKRIYHTVKKIDPESLVTYVNYPTTEYLELPFLDIVSFNIYLENKENYESYLSRIQNTAGSRPLLITEFGLDSRRNGRSAQASTLQWLIDSSFKSGCAGTFVFKWTDEWYRGTYDIEDWDFGLTTRDRKEKPSLKTVQKAYKDLPYKLESEYPKISIVLCTYNGSKTIAMVLEHLLQLDYPDYEIVVINDGSTDETPEILSRFEGIRIITTKNNGLSFARNLGCREAKGEIVAYIDDDAYPDPHWLKYLAYMYLTTSYVAIGGPNILPPKVSMVEECINNAPGNPTHVLLSDSEAEHIPGCNMTFRKDFLEKANGFDSTFRVAGDDVDMCIRIREKGWKIGYHPGAMVFHFRRKTIRAYFKQQFGYGKAEALLMNKWPQKHNSAGHYSWSGRVYEKGVTLPIKGSKPLVYHGVWGTAAFQRIYQPNNGLFSTFLLMPEWYLATIIIGLLSAIGLLWPKLYMFLPVFILMVIITLIQAVYNAKRAVYNNYNNSRFSLSYMRMVTLFLHLMQPLVRLSGRLKLGLAPWRIQTSSKFVLPISRKRNIWSINWHPSEYWLIHIEEKIKSFHTPYLRGGNFDSWDISVHSGLLGSASLLMANEDHEGGKQYLRFKVVPQFSKVSLIITFILIFFTIWSIYDKAFYSSIILLCLDIFSMMKLIVDSGFSTGSIQSALDSFEAEINKQYDNE